MQNRIILLLFLKSSSACSSHPPAVPAAEFEASQGSITACCRKLVIVTVVCGQDEVNEGRKRRWNKF